MLARITTYMDGSEARMYNKRLQFKQLEDGSYLVILETVTDTPEIPTVQCTIKRNKVVQIALRLSDNMMESLVVSYVKYREARGHDVNFTPFNDI